jgi:hypothetical protein
MSRYFSHDHPQPLTQLRNRAQVEHIKVTQHPRPASRRTSTLPLGQDLGEVLERGVLQDGVDHEDQTCADALPEGADTLLSDDLLGGFDHAEGTFLGFTGFDVLWVRTLSVLCDLGRVERYEQSEQHLEWLGASG